MIKIGDKIKIVSNQSGHNYTIGKIYTVDYAISGQFRARDENGWQGNMLPSSDIIRATYKKNELAKQIEEKEAEIFAIETKLNFMEEENREEFNEKEYQMYMALKLIENSDMTRSDKVNYLLKILD